jgi:hypothetical protein
MTEEPRLFEDASDLLRALTDAGADYVVVGAHALAAHGLPRATADFDVLVRPSAENARRVVSALMSFGAPLQAHGVGPEDFERPGTVYQLGLPPRRIDLLTSISGVDFDEAWGSRLEVAIGDLKVPVLGREALIKNKRATGRGKDLLDLEALVPAAPDPEAGP